jgi:alkylation response protein AidB-like acyl-CoA dehydrogenase
MKVAMPTDRNQLPREDSLDPLCARLAELAVEMDRSGGWPAEQLRLCGEAGVFRWFLDPQWGGSDWSEEQIVRGYLELAAACITTTFIITQRTGACRRIAGCSNQVLKERLLPGLARGDAFATVGISHLTTSRRHLGKPVLTAEAVPGGFRLEGMSPWVTGGAAADVIVTAATLVERHPHPGPLPEGEGVIATDRQLLIAVPTDSPGVRVADPLPLIGVKASSTGPVHLDGVELSEDWLIAGPVENVMASGLGGSTGGFETSTLAIGLAQAAIGFLATEAAKRGDLTEPMMALRTEHEQLLDDLIHVSRGESGCTKESIRQRANSLVLRSTQAALSAAKGSGYVVGHPAGRWCREALFFLVWSCPQPVAAANLCELAGIAY